MSSITEQLRSFSPTLIIDKDAENNAAFDNLDQRLGEVNRNEGSNFYAIVESLNDRIIAQNIATNDTFNKVITFFNLLDNGVLSYSNSSLSGLRNKMLQISGVLDFKQYVTKATLYDAQQNPVNVTKAVETVVRIDPALTDEEKEVVYKNAGDAFVKYMDVGTFSQAAEGDTDPINITVNASNGQAITYAISLAKEIEIELFLTAALDPEEATPYDMANKIKTYADEIIQENYENVIGKDFNIQDFYSVSHAIRGIKSVSISWANQNNTGDIFPNDNNKNMPVPKNYFLNMNLPLANINLAGNEEL